MVLKMPDGLLEAALLIVFRPHFIFYPLHFLAQAPVEKFAA